MRQQTPHIKGTAKTPQSHNGFVLPLVLIVSLMLGTGMMAMAMRTWIGVKGGIRQSQSREAREIAEAGTARLLESLNRRFAHLLIVDDDAWDNPPLTSSRCANSSSGKPTTTGMIGNGVYTLEAYSFEGTPFYGGKATIVRPRLSEVNSGPRTRSSTSILDVRPRRLDHTYTPCCAMRNEVLRSSRLREQEAGRVDG